MGNKSPLILVHGGAGTLFKGKVSEEREALSRAGLWAALRAGMDLLQAGASSLDAVEAAVRALEDCEAFNAGRGSVYTHAGGQEMDAAIMDGRDRSAGAVAGISRIRNPISLARRVMEQTPHVLLIGTGAEDFAREQGCEFAPPEYFHSDYRWQQLLQLRDGELTALDHAIGEPKEPPDGKFGTVGAVALDAEGNLASATSTGGMTNKRAGRVGDSPIIGAGTYADNASCAVSATGHGEYLIRTVIGYDIAARMKYANMTLQAAADAALAELESLGGSGGLIAVDAQGNWAMPYNTGRMYRGWLQADGQGGVEIY
ncbi:MAG: isoaspartyl peptidase/L-asparaginase family protein [Candidatus Sericytochromatia bacterium]